MYDLCRCHLQQLHNHNKSSHVDTKQCYTTNVPLSSTVGPAGSSPLEVHPAVSSFNYLPVDGNATPGDRGGSGGVDGSRVMDVTSSGLPEADLREAEGELNREADGRTTSTWQPGGTDNSTRKNENVQPLRTGILPGGTENVYPEEQTSDIVDVTSSGKPVADLREAEGEVNKKASTASGMNNTTGHHKDDINVDKTSGVLDINSSNYNTDDFSFEYMEDRIVFDNVNLLPPAIIICGDFNSTPQSLIYHYLNNGFVHLNNTDIRFISGQYLMYNNVYLTCADGHLNSGNTVGNFKHYINDLYNNDENEYNTWYKSFHEKIDVTLFKIKPKWVSINHINIFNQLLSFLKPPYYMLFCPIHLKSAYNNINDEHYIPGLNNEPSYTAYHGWQKGCVDYIWHNTHIHVEAIHELPNYHQVIQGNDLPNKVCFKSTIYT